MNWSVFFVVLLINSGLCLTQYLIEQIDRKRGKISPRHSIIPGTKSQKILYWEDYYTQTYGDLLCLVWIMNGFAHLLLEGQISLIQWIIFAVISLIAALGFLRANLQPGHKVDWGWPAEGKISWGGFSHLPYFGALSGMAVICLINMISGKVSGLLFWTTLSGGIAYIITFICDIKSGHFNPLEKA